MCVNKMHKEFNEVLLVNVHLAKSKLAGIFSLLL